MADFEAWLVFLILVVNVVGELQRKRTLAASRGFLAAARLSCYLYDAMHKCGACLSLPRSVIMSKCLNYLSKFLHHLNKILP